MLFVNLPLELLDAICEQAFPADLAALAALHSALYNVARSRLYRHLSISTASHNLQAVVTLANSPELAQHVRTFSLRIECSAIFRSFLRLVRAALSRMTELIHLDLFIDSSASWILSNSSSHYPRLIHFSSSFQLDHHVAEFLTKTEALLELEVDASDHPAVPILPPRSIPRLSQFIGSPHVASSIVPGRPVESIHLPSGDLTEEDLIMFAKSTAHVLILGATTSAPPLPLLISLSQRMPSLVYLRLMTTCDFSEIPQPSFYEQTAQVLTSFSDMKGFELGGLHWANAQKDQPWQTEPIIGDIMLLNVLVLDGEIERLPSFGVSMWDSALNMNDSEDEEVEKSSKKRRKRGDDSERSSKKRKKSSSDDDQSSDEAPKKSKRKRGKDLSDSDSDSDNESRSKRSKSKRSRSNSDDSSESDGERSSRKRKSKKERSKRSRSSGSETSSDDGKSRRSKSSKSLRRSPSPFETWDDLDTSGGGGFVYRAIRKERPVFGASEATCSQCPSFEFCKNGGPVNPRDCVYFNDWLVGGTVAAIESGP
ncbi:hypothetical protein H0H93_000440 [Arthromyces matolae]|nr:hypothetical protein H0H93_000440 [Arthromyces matolae]